MYTSYAGGLFRVELKNILKKFSDDRDSMTLGAGIVEQNVTFDIGDLSCEKTSIYIAKSQAINQI